MNYVAFLRGINVGGNRKVPMGDLQKLFVELGFTDVKTLLNSGNVLFASDETDISVLKAKIEAKLESVFGWNSDVIIRSQKDIQDIVERNRFESITVTPATRLYITFFSEDPHSTFQIPYESPEKNYKILEVSQNAIFSVLTLSEKYTTTDAMKILEKEFGKNITTRNWNTVVKLAAL
jgi:uncharacterized protein (DUF1697 family)